MNELQKVIFDIIVRIANTPGAFDHGDSVLYGLKNYIARHSLASDHYYISEGGSILLEKYRLGSPLRRSRINKLKQELTFEHPVPASVVMHAIRSSNRTGDEIARILRVADCVTLLSKTEDRLISSKYNSKMPDGWDFTTGNRFARYGLFDIALKPEKIQVTGSLVR